MIKNEKDRPDCGSFDKAEQPIENMIFVDFQYSCWTSPAVELHFFMNTSLQESLRPARFDEFIAYYHGHLETNLKRLKYKKSIPNLVEFKQQYRDKSFYGENQMRLGFFSQMNDSIEITKFSTRFYCVMHGTTIIA